LFNGFENILCITSAETVERTYVKIINNIGQGFNPILTANPTIIS